MALLEILNLGTISPIMGSFSPTSLSDALFTGTQQRVLAILFGRPDRSFYANEIISLTRAGTGAVQRELARLASAGLVTVSRIGNQKHYQANAGAPVFAELCAIVAKTFGLAEPLRAALEPLASQIDAAFVYGSVAKRQDTATSDVDLMVISDTLRYPEIFAAIEETSTRIGRPVNPTVQTRMDFRKQLARGNAFASRLLEQPKIWLFGAEDVLRT